MEDVAVYRRSAEILGCITHVHTDCSNDGGIGDAHLSLEQLALYASQRFLTGRHKDWGGVVFADHASEPSKPWPLEEQGPLVAMMRRKHRRTRELAESSGLNLLYGVEASILNDYSIDIPDSVQEKMDYVLAARHETTPSRDDVTSAFRSLAVPMDNPNIDAIAHPNRGLEYLPLDWEKLFEIAADSHTLVEVNLNEWFKTLKVPNPSWAPKSRGQLARYRGHWEDFLDTLGGSKAAVVIGWDFHHFNMDWNFPIGEGGLPPRNLGAKIGRFLEALDQSGINAGRIISCNFPSFLGWLSQPKASRRLSFAAR